MSHGTLVALNEQRGKLITNMRTTLDEAEKREGGLTAEDDATISKFNSDIDALDQRMKAVADALARDADIDASIRTALDAGTRGRIQSEDEDPNSFRNQLRGVSRKERGSAEAPGWSAYQGTARDFKRDMQRRDLTKGSATGGGNTVPVSFYDRLIEHMIESSSILQAGATILRTSTGESILVPTTTSFTTATLVAEGAAIPESDPAFGQRSLGAYGFKVLVQVSSELLQDTFFDLEGFLARTTGRAVGNGAGAYYMTGTGTNQPQGIVTAATAGVTGAASVAGAFTADDIIDLEYSVIAPYRNSPEAAFLLRDNSMAAFRKLKDEQGQYLWAPSLTQGVPSTFDGKPMYTDPNIAAIGLGAVSALFGDISAYIVRLVGTVRFERSDEYAFGNDLVTFRAILRTDGMLADTTGAVKKYTGNAA